MKLSVRTYPLGPIQTNCYIVSNRSKQCLIFDPGEEGERLIHEIKANQLKPLAIFLTHTHFDHIGAVNAVRDAFNIPVYVHEKEVAWLADPMKNGSGKYAELPNYIVEKPLAEHIIQEEQMFNIEDFTFKAVFTPGHSPGSISYLFEEDGFAIVGDTLFEGSIGRTDLIGGSMPVLLQSIHDKLLTLPEETIIYPGHGDYTTPAVEMDANPFLNGF
ncbi:MBL fold metallo-hydrolase [Metasolibacillus sp.]|uniref:MBL fold metallo-hydrolase n=1 Tax=Metasolibacillus sp. TaxID=2703680 RepID=UPI0025F17DDF|nr:MBL fold metallo-hydrolase [Metasolibacillus sp.]MCT6922638.1 MBL fold metallo-hydrolase [Metasolibacillus sp.]MCT6939023.1 MBL fold metallo-hydrolase [Metasolibacillus sp.]